jgi:hypothetical protein
MWDWTEDFRTRTGPHAEPSQSQHLGYTLTGQAIVRERLPTGPHDAGDANTDPDARVANLSSCPIL